MRSYHLVFAALASHVLPAASAPTAVELNVRAPVVEVHVCDKTEFRGVCENLTGADTTCINVPNVWNDRISSIKNDKKSDYKCTWYLNANCGGDSYDNQEDADLGDGNGRFDESISSYICVRQ